jgi:hypothetical protein
LKKLLVGIGLLLLGAIAALGWRLSLVVPEQYKITRAGRYNSGTVEDVWERVTGVERYPEWRKDILKVELQEKLRGHLVWKEYWKDGRAVTLEEADKIEKRRSVRCVIDQGGDFGGCWTFEIVGRNPGVALAITEALTVHHQGFRLLTTLPNRKEALDSILLDLGLVFGETSPRMGDSMVDVSRPLPEEKAATPASNE